MNKVTVACPGTIANLVCGFDILGMALDTPFDIMEVRLLDEPRVTVTSRDGFPLPAAPPLNTAGAPLIAMLEELNDTSRTDRSLPAQPPFPIGFEVLIDKNIKPGHGIGATAAAAPGAGV